MYTIGQLAKRYGLSRSTLIYYDKIGVLKPGGRSAANYRLYSNKDAERLDRIMLFRSAGLSLEAISELLGNASEGAGGDLRSVLENRLQSINGEIQGLREQQQVILQLLNDRNAVMTSRVLTKDSWVALLRAAGLEDEGMRNWHIEFEKSSPEAHQDFLESIGIGPEEIASIRAWSKAG
jgi:DNA-binding transcriptional MerR regulator